MAAAILETWGPSLTEATKRVTASLERKSASRRVEQAGEARVEGMDELRPRSVRSDQTTLKRLAETPGMAHGNVFDVTPKTVTKALGEIPRKLKEESNRRGTAPAERNAANQPCVG